MLKLYFQGRKFLLDDAPNNFQVYVKIPVNNPVSMADYLSPRNVFMTSFNVVRNVPGGFSYSLEIFYNCIDRFVVFFEKCKSMSPVYFSTFLMHSKTSST